jgi:MOSC domain-containing protein YiiM
VQRIEISGIASAPFDPVIWEVPAGYRRQSGDDFSWRFDGWYEGLPKSPTDRGSIHACVVRTGPGERETPERIELVAGAGIVGDSWKVHRHSSPGNQVSLINVHVLRSLADGDESRMPLSGDNLHVDLELSEANLPVGTLLHIGTATLRVSPVPHRPCGSFVARFGASAAKKVARATRIGKRGRGVLCEVVASGAIQVGDSIRVERQPPDGR